VGRWEGGEGDGWHGSGTFLFASMDVYKGPVDGLGLERVFLLRRGKISTRWDGDYLGLGEGCRGKQRHALVMLFFCVDCYHCFDFT